MYPTDDITNCRVLIVDDEPDNLSVIEKVLAFHGAQVTTARDGLEGLRMAQDLEPMVVLVDLSMPIMDGWDMHCRLRSNPKTAHIPVVAVTAHALTEDKARVFEAGFNGYISKPFSVPALLREIAKQVRASRTASAGAACAGTTH